MNPFSKSYVSDSSDEELIKNSLKGDGNALDELLRKHQPYIYNVAWKMVQDPNDAADLTQEAMLKIVTHLSKFKFNSTFRTWAYRIVVNHFLNEKKKHCEERLTGFDDMAYALDSIPNHDMSEVEQKESRELVKEMNYSCISGMLLCLTREQRLIFIIGEMMGGDHIIGSEIMQISKDNFRAKLSKARKDLYTFMQNKCGLVNKSNPCRCHKKVKVAVDMEVINAKDLLFNKKEYVRFQNFIKEDADFMIDEMDKRYAELYQNLTFKEDFDRKSFITKVIENSNWKSKLNLN
ncbi:RNA polymerase sigma factor [Aquimarina sp. 2304DJ70-9]|uniref:RNA polymerase sigma factor n=1 Tax=Aquimarina penaris TaxID=3231044 RepID=UPI0034635D1E